MAESTNQPSNLGPNPGRPPMNDQGIGRPNPAPPPPSSLPRLPESKDDAAIRNYEAFLDAAKQIKEATEEIKKSQGQFTEATKEVVKTNEDRLKAEIEHRDAVEALKKEYEEFTEKTESGDTVFRAGTDFIQMEFLRKLGDLNDAFDLSLSKEATAKQKATQIDDQIRRQSELILSLNRRVNEIGQSIVADGIFAQEAMDEYKAVIEEAISVAKKTEETQTEAATNARELLWVAKRLVQVEQAAMKQKEEFRKAEAEEAKKREEGDAAAAAAAAADVESREKEEESRKNTEDQVKRFEKQAALQARNDADAKTIKELLSERGGGIFNARDIGKEFDSILNKERDRLKELMPDASMDTIEDHLRNLVKQGAFKQRLEDTVHEKYRQEILDLMEKEVETVMREEKVSKKAAIAIVEMRKKSSSTEFGKEFKRLTELQKKSVEEIRSLNEKQEQALAFGKEKDRRDLELQAEERRKDGIAELSDFLKVRLYEIKDLLKLKDKGGFFWWLKMIVFILGAVLGATVGYIFYKIKFIANMITALPRLLGSISSSVGRIPLIGKSISDKLIALQKTLSLEYAKLLQGINRIFAPFTRVFSAINRAISSVVRVASSIGQYLARIGRFISNMARFFPQMSGVLRAFMAGFRIAFAIVGKIAVPLMIVTALYDVIMGAIRGYKEMGGFKGIVLGLIGGIVNWLTFGLMDFKTILEGLDAVWDMTIGKVVRVFTIAFDTIGGVLTNFRDTLGNIIDAFKGPGSFMSKLGNALMEAGKGILRSLAITFGGVLKLLLNSIFPFGDMVDTVYMKITGWLSDVGNWFTRTLTPMWEGLVRFVKLLGNLHNIIYDKIKDFAVKLKDKIVDTIMGWVNKVVDVFKGIMGAIADKLGGIPIIGPKIKEYLSGNESSTSVSKNIDSSTVEKMLKDSKVLTRVEREAMAVRLSQSSSFSPMGYGGSKFTGRDVNSAASRTEMAKLAAQTAASTVAVNAPTTTVVKSGGGEAATFLPSSSRNNDPTIRRQQGGGGHD